MKLSQPLYSRYIWIESLKICYVFLYQISTDNSALVEENILSFINFINNFKEGLLVVFEPNGNYTKFHATLKGKSPVNF